MNLEYKKAKYRADNTLAVIIFDNHEVYGNLTVNLNYENPKDYLGGDYKQYVDCNNIPKEIIDNLIKEEKIKPTGKMYQSGFVTYQLYEFNKEWIDNMKEVE